MLSSKPYLPLQEKVLVHSRLKRIIDLLIFFLLLAFLFYRLASLKSAGDGSSSLHTIAFLCESWFTVVWLLDVNSRWNPVKYNTFLERLSKRLEDLPTLDVFVTTADPVLEPPIVTVNTVLSLLAVNYPSHRLACYVSDDGGSLSTYYAMREASKFAKLWVPFCKKYNVRVRAPFVYFSTEMPAPATSSADFRQEWKYIKGEYLELTRRIENYRGTPVDEEFVEFTSIERGNHATIIKVISENKEEKGVPHLVYVAREKRPKNPHHFKAGAMNVLTRVSGVMTSAPFILNVDCDMFANNPDVVLHAMCLLFGFEEERFSGFVQAPQEFHGALKDDPFGNQLVVLQNTVGLGIGGIQGPFYGGTGCFHRRKIIYGASPESTLFNGGGSYNQLRRVYGNSEELLETTNEVASNSSLGFSVVGDLSSKIPAAKEVAACNYEFNTSWGKEIGWMYGSIVEDVLTGIRIHARGWRSVYLTPDPSGFLGSAPTGGPASLTQYKRWATGLLEVLLHANGPILATLNHKLSFRQCLGYLTINFWPLTSVVEYCYALLPAYCILNNVNFLPKESTLEFVILATIFTLINVTALGSYLGCGLSVRAWWNNQRMSRISSSTSFFFGLLSVILKMLGISETVFEVTRKDQDGGASKGASADPGRFTFDSSPLFVTGLALVVVHIATLGIAAVRSMGGRAPGWGLGELVCSAWLLASFWPFVRGIFATESYGIPWAVIWKAVGLSLLLLCLFGLGQV